MNRHVAVEQDGINWDPAHLALHLGDLVSGAEVGSASREAALHTSLAGAYHDLRGLVTLEDVREVIHRRAVDHREVRHVGNVVYQLAAVSVDGPFLDYPVTPLLGGVAGGEPWNRELVIRVAAFGIVPDEQQIVLFAG